MERFNRTLEGMLAKVVNDFHTDWDLHLQMALFAYRTAVHETTDYTPFRVLFGRTPTLPVDIMLDRQLDEHKDIPRYVKSIRSTMTSMFSDIRHKQHDAHLHNKGRIDKRAAKHQFHVGDCVWLHVPSRKKGTSPKFMSYWRGPYTVLDKMSVYNYKIQLIGTTKTQIVHYNRMKLCYSDPNVNDTAPASVPEHSLPGGFTTIDSSEPGDLLLGDSSIDHEETSLGSSVAPSRPRRNRRPVDYGPYVAH